MSALRVSATAGDAGPILVLAGEADVTNAEQLRDVLGAQLASGAVYLTIDAAWLSFADSGAIGILAGAAKTLKELGGGLVLLRPRKALIRTMTLLGVDQVMTIQAATDVAHELNDDGTGPGLQTLNGQGLRCGCPGAAGFLIVPPSVYPRGYQRRHRPWPFNHLVQAV
jgi:anti-anti-sigma factor